MYTSANINPASKTKVNSSRRIYLDHKTVTSSIVGIRENENIITEPVTATIHFTCVPLDGKSEKDIAIAHGLSMTIGQTLFEGLAIGRVEVTTKVREKDQTIMSEFTFNQELDTDIEIKGREKAIWHPLKMETLKTLLADAELGPFIPVNDVQIAQLGEYIYAV